MATEVTSFGVAQTTDEQSIASKQLKPPTNFLVRYHAIALCIECATWWCGAPAAFAFMENYFFVLRVEFSPIGIRSVAAANSGSVARLVRPALADLFCRSMG